MSAEVESPYPADRHSFEETNNSLFLFIGGVYKDVLEKTFIEYFKMKALWPLGKKLELSCQTEGPTS